MSTTQPKCGLVLAGGGAKGSFQWGVIESLIEAGIQFDCVSGTSVGALSAALVATEQYAFGSRVWRDLSWKTLSEKVSGNPTKDRLRYVRVFAGALASVIAGLPFPDFLATYEDLFAGTILLMTLALFISSIFLLIKVFGYQLFSGSDPVIASGWFAFFTSGWSALLPTIIILLTNIYTDRNNRQDLLTVLYGFSVVITLLTLFVAVLNSITWVLMLGIFLLLLLASIALLDQSLPFIQAFPYDQLGTYLRVAAAGTWNIPCYVTIAHGYSIYDPEKPKTTMTPASSPTALYDGAILRLLSDEMYIATYQRLPERKQDETTQRLMESAFLPFGIFKSQYVLGEPVDGGLADNLPVLPLLEYESCDELIVISLSGLMDTSELVIKNYIQQHRKQRLLELAVKPWTSQGSWTWNSLTGDSITHVKLPTFHDRFASSVTIFPCDLPYRPAPVDTLDFSNAAALKLLDLGKTEGRKLAKRITEHRATRREGLGG